MAAIEDLKHWDSIDLRAKSNLLLGNGFSIAYASEFSYSSLRSKAIEVGILDDEEQELFEKFNTVDFEFLLRRLNDASIVNRLLHIDYQTPSGKYQGLKESLISVIGEVHPESVVMMEEERDRLTSKITGFDKVFTTNYDLLLYWIMASDFTQFTDYFWSGESCQEFDPFDTDNWNKQRTEVFYLHGALFIFNSRKKGATYKIKNNGISLMESIRDEILNNSSLPLFVSEGSWQEKHKALKRNSYLTFAFNEFRDVDNGLTIYGSSLNALSDGHLIRAIRNSKRLRVVAISIYTRGKSPHEIIDAMTSIEMSLRGAQCRLEFFDYSTSPFVPQ